MASRSDLTMVGKATDISEKNATNDLEKSGGQSRQVSKGIVHSKSGLSVSLSSSDVPDPAFQDEVQEPGNPSIDPWQVEFEPGELSNPKNWGVKYRWYLTFASGLLTLNSTFSSSIPSGIAASLERDFPLETIPPAVLCISLFVAGYVVGPIVWGPSSEIWGRRPIFLYPYIIYTALQIANALIPTHQLPGLLVIRFLSGVMASVPINNAGALLADIWDGDRRGKAMSIFALAPFAGPSLGPIVSGYIQVSGASWRWVFWTTTIFAGLCTLLVFFGVPETYPPVILAKKAARMRKETGEDRWYAPLEKLDTSFKARVHAILFKPFVMLALEPMLLTIVTYMSLAYGIMYLLFPAIPFVFVGNHGFNVGQNGLVFLSVFAGGAICTAFFMLVVEPRYLRHVALIAPKPVKPEKRLELAVLCSWSLVVSMFWFGWTSGSEIHWISPVLALCLLGIAMLGLFVSLINYIVDVYLVSAASALAGATVVRSIFGAVFPLFASKLYENLGTQWASTVVGFIALILAPAPIVLMKFGPRIRARSRYSANKIV